MDPDNERTFYEGFKGCQMDLTLRSVGNALQQAKDNASLRELQSATGEELSALLPSVLDRAFKGEL